MKKDAPKQQNGLVTREDLRAALEREGLAFEQFQEGSAWIIVVPRLGARVLGAGLGDENALWAAPGLSARGWEHGGNAGGERTWIAPEVGPQGFFGATVENWRVPPELDPGRYVPVSEGRPDEGWRAWRTELIATASDGVSFPVAITRAVRLRAERAERAARPAAALRAEIRTTLENTGTEVIDRRIGLWHIAQVPADRAGLVTVALRPGSPAGADAVHACYISPPRGVLRTLRGAAHVRVRGGPRYKIGISAAAAAGTITFSGRSRTGPGAIRVSLECPVEPRGTYVDRPPAPGETERQGPGDAMQAYNDPGTGAMAFAEIEAHAPAVTLPPGGRQVFDVVMRVDGPPRLGA